MTFSTNLLILAKEFVSQLRLFPLQLQEITNAVQYRIPIFLTIVRFKLLTQLIYSYWASLQAPMMMPETYFVFSKYTLFPSLSRWRKALAHQCRMVSFFKWQKLSLLSQSFDISVFMYIFFLPPLPAIMKIIFTEKILIYLTSSSKEKPRPKISFSPLGHCWQKRLKYVLQCSRLSWTSSSNEQNKVLIGDFYFFFTVVKGMSCAGLSPDF